MGRGAGDRRGHRRCSGRHARPDARRDDARPAAGVAGHPVPLPRRPRHRARPRPAHRPMAPTGRGRGRGAAPLRRPVRAARHRAAVLPSRAATHTQDGRRMSATSRIEWTDASWNPVTGCTRTSEGCLRCYIDRTPPFRMAHRRFDGPGIGATTGVKLHADRLGIPTRWRTHRRVFVCSLADLFHQQVPDRFIAEVFAVASIAAQHTFQVLTKRHARLRSLLNSAGFWATVDADSAHLWGTFPCRCHPTPTALPDWVIVGGESGPKARPMHPDWARSLREQCTSAGVAFFYKQSGEWVPAPSNYGPDVPDRARGATDLVFANDRDTNGQIMLRVGRHRAGRILDGRTWDEYPRTAEAVTGRG